MKRTRRISSWSDPSHLGRISLLLALFIFLIQCYPVGFCLVESLQAWHLGSTNSVEFSPHSFNWIQGDTARDLAGLSSAEEAIGLGVEVCMSAGEAGGDSGFLSFLLFLFVAMGIGLSLYGKFSR